MSGTAFRSRPEYTRLRPVAHAQLSIAAASGPGLSAVASAFPALPALPAVLKILCAQGDMPSASWATALAALPAPPDSYCDRAALLASLAQTLASATMATRLYVAGEENFVSAVRLVASAAGLADDAIQSEHCGGVTRRVQCVHCKTFLTEVSASPIRCTGCGENLLVRDHYSHRLGAYMGVCIDADAPGSAPAPEPLAPLQSVAVPVPGPLAAGRHGAVSSSESIRA